MPHGIAQTRRNDACLWCVVSNAKSALLLPSCPCTCVAQEANFPSFAHFACRIAHKFLSSALCLPFSTHFLTRLSRKMRLDRCRLRVTGPSSPNINARGQEQTGRGDTLRKWKTTMSCTIFVLQRCACRALSPPLWCIDCSHHTPNSVMSHCRAVSVSFWRASTKPKKFRTCQGEVWGLRKSFDGGQERAVAFFLFCKFVHGRPSEGKRVGDEGPCHIS